MWQYIEKSHRDILLNNGLSRFSDFMTFQGGRVLKELSSRMILKIELPSGSETKSFFLKRHKSSLRIGEIGRAFFSGFSLSWGRKEWEVIQAFQKLGIPTLVPVAAGEKVSWFWQESFLMTEELKGFQPLDKFLQSYFVPPLPPEKIIEKRAIIYEVAQIARVMHKAGFNHRDFYCCHIFINRMDSRHRHWCVLDLQRVDRRRWFRRRWIVKDLAALNYSAQPRIITRTDRLRFLRHYLDVKIDAAKKEYRMIRQVSNKTDKIMRHDRKLKARQR